MVADVRYYFATQTDSDRANTVGQVINQVVRHYETGMWNHFVGRPPGLPADVRGEVAIPFRDSPTSGPLFPSGERVHARVVRSAFIAWCLNYIWRDKDFALCNACVADQESASTFGRPANSFDNRPSDVRAIEGASRITAWGIYQWNTHPIDRVNFTLPWRTAEGNVSPAEEFISEASFYKSIWDADFARWGTVLDAAFMQWIWHSGPPGHRRAASYPSARAYVARNDIHDHRDKWLRRIRRSIENLNQFPKISPAFFRNPFEFIGR